MKETQDWSFPLWRRSLLAAAAGAAAVAAWNLSWRMLGAPYSVKDIASSSAAIAVAIFVLVVSYPARNRREEGKRAPEARSASGLGRRILQAFEPLDYDRPGSNFPRMSNAVVRAKLVVAVVMVACLSLPLAAAGVWASRLDTVLLGLVLAAMFSYSGACDAYTLRRRRRPGRN